MGLEGFLSILLNILKWQVVELFFPLFFEKEKIYIRFLSGFFLAHSLKNMITSAMLNTSKHSEDAHYWHDQYQKLNHHLSNYYQIGEKIQIFDVEVALNEVVSKFVGLEKCSCLKYIKVNKAKLKGNRSIFQEVIYNMLVNSVEATGKPSALVLYAYKAKHNLIINIADFGPGLNSFERTLSLNGGYSRKRFGWGYGFYLAKKMTKYLLKGSVKLVSAKGVGTTVQFCLPLNR